MASTSRSWTAWMVAFVVMGGALCIDYYVLANGLPRADGASHDAVIMIITAWNALALNVVSYYFGNSANSDRKTELMAQGNAAGTTVQVRPDQTTVSTTAQPGASSQP